jgi:hypothetical protein
MTKGIVRALCTAIVGALVVGVAGCAPRVVGGAAVRAPVPPGSEGAVVTLMDTGNYPTVPLGPIGNATDRGAQGLVEAQRMAEVVLGPWRIDADLIGLGDLILDTKGTQPLGDTGALTFSEVASDEQAAIAAAHGFVAGFTTRRVSVGSAGSGKRLQNAVLRFPDAASAAAAAGEMAGARPAPVAPSPPEPAPIRDHPEALAVTWKTADGANVVESFAAHGPFVLYQWARMPLKVFGENADNMVAQTLAEQARALDQFVPTDVGRLADLPIDFTGQLFARTLRAPDGKAPYMVGTWRPAAWLHFEDDPLKSQTWFRSAGVEAVAQWTTTVYQARTVDGGAQLADQIAADLNDTAGVKPISGVPGLPNAKCFNRPNEELPDTAAQSLQRIAWHYKCVARADRYAFTAFSASETDVKQQIAAQYRILAGE